MGAVETFDDASPLPPNRTWKATGGGGTDFRPVFDYVEKHPELEPALLIYFTDGYGIFPVKMPPYDTVFVFMREDYRDVDVPPWAMKLVQ